MIPGDRFGYLVVTGEADRKYRTQRYECLCACGRRTVQFGKDLRAGIVISCGCIGELGRQAARNATQYRAEHERRERVERQAEARQASHDSIGALYSFARVA